MLRKIIPPLFKVSINYNNRYLLKKNIFLKSQYRATLQEQLIQYSNNLSKNVSPDDYSQLVKNYLELSQKSFSDYVKTVDSDPQLLLMLLSTFQDQKKIKEFLPNLYNKINYLEKEEMLHLLQKVLAFKPAIKPRIPHPRPLQGIESILVLMSELYLNDQLVQWIKYVPLYRGNQLYLVAMGYFSILQKMSSQVKQKNRQLLIKCHKKFASALQDQTLETDARFGIVLLGFQLTYKQSVNLFMHAQIDLKKIDYLKKMLFIINVSKFLIKQNLMEQFKQKQDFQMKQLNSSLQELLIQINSMDFSQFLQIVKVEIYLDLWRVLKNQTSLTDNYALLLNKLGKLAINKQYRRNMKALTSQELLLILQCIQKHKIDNQKLLKRILIFFSAQLPKMDKTHFIRLLKCLVTYVRQCEQYLINTRKVLQQRKLQFSNKQAEEINQILSRVMVLFPRPFRVA